MSAGGAGAGFTVSTGEAALSRLLSSIIIVACSGAAMLCYRAPSHRSLLWMMLSAQGGRFAVRRLSRSLRFLPLSSTAREGKEKDILFLFFVLAPFCRHSHCAAPILGVAQGRSLDERMHA